jgi:hypothetical protein
VSAASAKDTHSSLCSSAVVWQLLYYHQTWCSSEFQSSHFLLALNGSTADAHTSFGTCSRSTPSLQNSTTHEETLSFMTTETVKYTYRMHGVESFHWLVLH